MSRLGRIERHLQSLREIRDIINSMKSLAYMETRKLDRLVSAQQALTREIELAASDLLAFHPSILPERGRGARVRVLVGTERGFCGDFNEALVRYAKAKDAAASDSIVLAIGHKLNSALDAVDFPARRIISMYGAGVAEEIDPTLGRIVNALDSIRAEHGVLGVSALYSRSESGFVERELLPPFGEEATETSRQFAHAPCLNMPPADLLAELTHEYLLAALHEILYTSLMRENERRVAHLGAAVRHLDDKLGRLQNRTNALRQEQITEEIEVILLSTADLIEPPSGPGADPR